MSAAPAPERAVGAVVVEHAALLLVRRGHEPEAGSWSVPGGRVEHGETLAQAVEREVLEETGLTVRCGELVGWVERIDARHHFVILDFTASPVADPPWSLSAGGDAADARWVPLPDVPGLGLVNGLEAFLRRHGVLRAQR